MRYVIHSGMTAIGGLGIAAFLWFVLAMPGFVSEQDTLTHALSLAQVASR